jgi:hypothetical protein
VWLFQITLPYLTLPYIRKHKHRVYSPISKSQKKTAPTHWTNQSLRLDQRFRKYQPAQHPHLFFLICHDICHENIISMPSQQPFENVVRVQVPLANRPLLQKNQASTIAYQYDLINSNPETSTNVPLSLPLPPWRTIWVRIRIYNL